jgi:hypothetical protein
MTLTHYPILSQLHMLHASGLSMCDSCNNVVMATPFHHDYIIGDALVRHSCYRPALAPLPLPTQGGGIRRMSLVLATFLDATRGTDHVFDVAFKNAPLVQYFNDAPNWFTVFSLAVEVMHFNPNAFPQALSTVRAVLGDLWRSPLTASGDCVRIAAVAHHKQRLTDPLTLAVLADALEDCGAAVEPSDLQVAA